MGNQKCTFQPPPILQWPRIARGVRKGTAKAGKGVGKAKKFVKRSIDKACLGKGCRKVLSGARKVANRYEKARNVAGLVGP
jgi:hypothetical protein